MRRKRLGARPRRGLVRLRNRIRHRALGRGRLRARRAVVPRIVCVRPSRCCGGRGRGGSGGGLGRRAPRRRPRLVLVVPRRVGVPALLRARVLCVGIVRGRARLRGRGGVVRVVASVRRRGGVCAVAATKLRVLVIGGVWVVCGRCGGGLGGGGGWCRSCDGLSWGGGDNAGANVDGGVVAERSRAAFGERPVPAFCGLHW